MVGDFYKTRTINNYTVRVVEVIPDVVSHRGLTTIIRYVTISDRPLSGVFELPDFMKHYIKVGTDKDFYEDIVKL